MKTITMFGLFLCTMLFSLSSVYASEQTLATVSRSDGGGSLRFAASVNATADLTGLVFATSSTRISVTVDEIDGRSKVVYRDSGQDVISIKAVNFSLYSGGTLDLRYLKEYNMFSTNDYKHLTLDLERDGNTWYLSKGGRKVRGLNLNVYRWGISSIDVYYEK